jgi:hypothetical protein
VKRRVLLPLAQALRVCEGFPPEAAAPGESERRIIAEVHDLVKRGKFKPVMVMRYNRTAYAAREPESDLRVTFDEGIRARFDNLTPEPDDRRFDLSEEMHGGGIAVMEVKVTGCIPFWLSRTIAAAGCRMQSHSKYSTALEQHDPVLRAMLSPNWRARLAAGEVENAGILFPLSAPAFAPFEG